MGANRPQGGGVMVGAGVAVGMSVGATVAVLVAGAVGDIFGVALFSGELQPARKDRNKIQEMSFVLGRLKKWNVGFIEVSGSHRMIQE